MKKFIFEYWFCVIDEDNKDDEYYDGGEEYMYCDEGDNLMVSNSRNYKCPVCGYTEGRGL